jgi:hypothetical protein
MIAFQASWLVPSDGIITQTHFSFIRYTSNSLLMWIPTLEILENNSKIHFSKLESTTNQHSNIWGRGAFVAQEELDGYHDPLAIAASNQPLQQHRQQQVSMPDMTHRGQQQDMRRVTGMLSKVGNALVPL